MNRTNVIWAAILIIVVAVFLLKPWNCFTAVKESVKQKTVNMDSVWLAKADSLIKSVESLKKCSKKSSGRQHTYVRPTYIRPITDNEESPTPAPNTITYDAPAASSATPSSVSSSGVTNLCGSNNYTEFAVQLNDNSGNWWPQIALDRDQKQYNYSVPNTTRDGINFRIAISQFVDYFTGDVCVTTSGKIGIRAGALSDYLGPQKIVKILLLTTGATQWKLVPMSLEGDYYVWQK
ncbi:MAG: hypothetical protein WC249_02110 [Patescibacteria group bacterium]|jgi:hypothetical protein